MRTAIAIGACAVAFTALAAGSAAAQEKQGIDATSAVKPADTTSSPKERVAPAAHPEHRRGEPAAQRKPAPRRRSVQQIIATVPPPLAGPSYGPTLTAPAPAPAPARGMAPVSPPPPAALGTCQGGACTDAAGATYYGGVGNAVISSQGRLCSRNGQTVQCF